MTTTSRIPAVRAYLDELQRALADRPADERDLVLDGVRQHIEDAVGSGTADDERVQQVLDDLGDPMAIAAESAVGPVAPGPVDRVPFLDRRAGTVLVVLLLAIGGLVVPVLGWVAGVVLLWMSHAWGRVDRLVGTLALPVAVAALLGARLLWPVQMTSTCDGTDQDGGFCAPVLASGFPMHLAILLVPALGTAVALLLLVRARPRG